MNWVFRAIKQKFCFHDYQFHHWVHDLNTKYPLNDMIKKCRNCGKTIYAGEYFMPDLLNNTCHWDVKDE